METEKSSQTYDKNRFYVKLHLKVILGHWKAFEALRYGTTTNIRMDFMLYF